MATANVGSTGTVVQTRKPVRAGGANVGSAGVKKPRKPILATGANVGSTGTGAARPLKK